jgi:hypothetical protein
MAQFDPITGERLDTDDHVSPAKGVDKPQKPQENPKPQSGGHGGKAK